MSDYHKKALFIYTEEASDLCEQVENNPFGTTITSIPFDTFLAEYSLLLESIDHVVVSGHIKAIKEIIQISQEHSFSIGIVALKRQKSLIDCYGLTSKLEPALDTALKKDTPSIDIITCNGEILLFKGTIGRLPLLDGARNASKTNIFRTALRKMGGLRLLSFKFSSTKNNIDTAACGCMIVQHHEGSLASKIIANDSSPSDGMISLVIAAPRSVMDYFNFIFRILGQKFDIRKMTGVIGYIKTKSIQIDCEPKLEVYIDGEKTTSTPLECRVIPGGARINIGEKLREEISNAVPAKETDRTSNLPSEKELTKAKQKRIPFFSYASEERFRDLFIALRDDASINVIYLVLMVLSTGLATVGLYLSSSSVVIGAMLLAPLMSPIVSLAMGLLRRDDKLSLQSLKKIIFGISIALLTAALISLLIPHKPITAEMEARLNPSLLDLAVAILAGVAGAYTKSYKEILQSLAGVAIAVALVPPLSVAGIGLGRLDINFFSQAFLLFTTNLIGIIIAAVFTFRFLGFSAAIQNKRGILAVLLIMCTITVPLYFSYNRIVEKSHMEASWKTRRFLVNDKYLIVEKATLFKRLEKDIIYIDLLARDQLNRQELAEFKQKVQQHLNKELIIRANITYIP